METEKRLIDANHYDQILDKREMQLMEYSGSISGAIKGCRAILAQEPTVDAVEVVRCKDCENWQKPWLVDQTLGMCQVGKKSLTEPYHFCSYGERKCNGC